MTTTKTRPDPVILGTWHTAVHSTVGPESDYETCNQEMLAARMFGSWVQLASGLVERYHSDFYHDARFIGDACKVVKAGSGRHTLYLWARDNGTVAGFDRTPPMTDVKRGWRFDFRVRTRTTYTAEWQYVISSL